MAAFGRLPVIDHVVVSPDGSRIAFRKAIAEHQDVVAIVSMRDHQIRGAVQLGDAKLRALDWVDDDDLLLTTSTTVTPRGFIGPRDEFYMLQVYDVAKDEVRPLLKGFENRTMNVTFGPRMIRRSDGRTLLFVNGLYMDLSDWVQPALFRIDVQSGHEELIRKGSPATRRWLVDDEGTVVAEGDYDDEEERWALRIRQDQQLQEVAAGADPYDRSGLLGFDTGGDALIVELVDGNDLVWKSLSLVDASWGAETREAFGNEILLDRLTDRMIGRFREDDDAQYSFTEPAVQARWDQLVASFPGERVALVSMSDSAAQFVVLVDGPIHGDTYEFADTTAHTVEHIGNAYDGLPMLSEVRPITYRAADGLEISAYLTLPNGRAPVGLPLVVLPHGGPMTRDRMGFDWWAQALAARGYAVLQPNYRGSTVSPRLLAAGYGEWGRKMQSDVSDGVRFLAAEKIVDPQRVCVVGASYGGYVALAGVTLESGVYRCAVSVAGVSDLPQLLRWMHKRHGRRPSATVRYWDHFLGVTSPDDPILATLSPIDHVATASVPVMLIHGRDDTVVPYEQSALMADALAGAGKPVELVALDGEDHWLSRSATRLQMLEHTIAFLNTHNPPE